MALVAFLAAVFWWVGGLPARALPGGQVETFLESNALRPGAGGKVFCEADVLGARLRETSSGLAYQEYVYADCQEYHLDRDVLETGEGVSVPVVITARRGAGGYSLIGYQEAPDGGDLGMFPPLIRAEIAAAEHSPGPSGLSSRATAYFRR